MITAIKKIIDIISVLIYKHECRLSYCCKSLADFFQAVAANYLQISCICRFLASSLICPCKIELPSASPILARKNSVHASDSDLVNKSAS